MSQDSSKPVRKYTPRNLGRASRTKAEMIQAAQEQLAKDRGMTVEEMRAQSKAEREEADRKAAERGITIAW